MTGAVSSPSVKCHLLLKAAPACAFSCSRSTSRAPAGEAEVSVDAPAVTTVRDFSSGSVAAGVLVAVLRGAAGALLFRWKSLERALDKK